MISDILSDAIDEIRGYLRDLPEVYESHRAEIDEVLARMEALRVALDTPPLVGVN